MGFNPLEIGSTLQKYHGTARYFCRGAGFQSPRNRVNTSKEGGAGQGRRVMVSSFNPLEIGSTLQKSMTRRCWIALTGASFNPLEIGSTLQKMRL